ncbi:MAG: beta-aspartyl-dipeptidase (metallo-type) [Flavobacterium sp.]|jgi:beta-aspartyl-dipeptidase (metallo-type)
MFKLISYADVYTPRSLGIAHVLCCGEKIVYVGATKPALGIGLALTEYDFEGRALVPGFIDGHTHITGGGGETGFASKVPTVPLSDFTSAGVTSAIGLLGTDDITRSTSSLISACFALREEGMSAWCYTGGYHFPLTTLTDSAAKDIVHIDCVIGIGELAISDHRSSQLSWRELARVASEAHVAGLMTGKAGIVHLHLGDGENGLSLMKKVLLKTEIPNRVLNPTHVNRLTGLFDQACEFVKDGTYIDLTAFPMEEDDPGISITNAVTKYINQDLPLDKITVSSDGGGCLPVFDKQGVLSSVDFGRCSSLNQALFDLLDIGLSLEQVLPLFSSNVAALLRLKNKGNIIVGADADLVGLGNNHQISDVMCRGEWHKQNTKLLIKGKFE